MCKVGASQADESFKRDNMGATPGVRLSPAALKGPIFGGRAIFGGCPDLLKLFRAFVELGLTPSEIARY